MRSFSISLQSDVRQDSFSWSRSSPAKTQCGSWMTQWNCQHLRSLRGVPTGWWSLHRRHTSPPHRTCEWWCISLHQYRGEIAASGSPFSHPFGRSHGRYEHTTSPSQIHLSALESYRSPHRTAGLIYCSLACSTKISPGLPPRSFHLYRASQMTCFFYLLLPSFVSRYEQPIAHQSLRPLLPLLHRQTWCHEVLTHRGCNHHLFPLMFDLALFRNRRTLKALLFRKRISKIINLTKF